MKMSGKSDFLFSLELASSTIGLHIGKSCFGVFSNLNANYPFTDKRCTKCGWLPWQQKFFFIFSLVCGLVYPKESLKRYFSKCSILALEKRYLEKD